MRLLANTPRKAWQLAAIALAAYISAPFLAAAYYAEMLRKGAYPPYADSIGIPIYDDFKVAIVFAPVFCAMLVVLLHRYPGPVPLRTWNTKRTGWSLLCTVLFGLLIAVAAVGLIDAWRWRLPLELLNVGIWVWLLLALRAVAVSRAIPSRPAA
jgi:hypothetical protein